MVRLVSLKKSNHFKIALKEKKFHTDFFSIFAAKNFIKSKYRNDLIISFVMKKKIGNAVKRNRIKRKLKSIVQKLVKMNNLINLNYTYVIFGKEKTYKELSDSLFEKMKKSFKRIDGVEL
mgnify:CR=1 FL=1